MIVTQVVDTTQMPEELRKKFFEKAENEFGGARQGSYHPYVKSLIDQLEFYTNQTERTIPDFIDAPYLEELKNWLVSQGVDLEKPYLVLMWWEI